MDELVESIALHSGLTIETSTTALYTVSEFVKEQYPLFSTTVDQVLGTATISKEINA